MTDGPAERRRAFGDALRAAMRAAGVTQDALCEMINKSQAAVSQWVNGQTEPDQADVFEIERILHVRPGALSRYLGYLPLGAVKSVATLENAIKEDPRLSDLQKDSLLLSLKALLQNPGNGRGRPRR